MEPLVPQEGHVPRKYTAGFKLLNKFSGQWEQLHKTSEQNIQKAKIAMNKLDHVDRCCRERLDALDSFVANYKALSGLEEQINNIGCDLNNLERSFVKIEECLSQLAEQNEQNNCDRFIRDYQGNHEAQMQMVKIQTELNRDRLMAEHLQRVQEFEREQQQTLEERRRVLAKEFEAEKSRYLEKTTNNKV